MAKAFNNKKFTYVIIAILLALQLIQSITNWCSGGFNGGSLILCILMLGLLILVGVGIAKKNKLLTIISGVSILSVVIYVLTSNYSGLIQEWIDGKAPIVALVTDCFASIATLLLIGCFILVILRAFGINKDLEKINIIFSIIMILLFLVVIIIPFATGFLTDPAITVYRKIYQFARDFFALFIALLVPCIWHQLEEIKE